MNLLLIRRKAWLHIQDLVLWMTQRALGHRKAVLQSTEAATSVTLERVPKPVGLHPEQQQLGAAPASRRPPVARPLARQWSYNSDQRSAGCPLRPCGRLPPSLCHKLCGYDRDAAELAGASLRTNWTVGLESGSLSLSHSQLDRQCVQAHKGPAACTSTLCTCSSHLSASRRAWAACAEIVPNPADHCVLDTSGLCGLAW